MDQTTTTYLESAWLSGSNSTNNIEILQQLIILEPFYEIRNILDMCVTSSMFFHIHHQAFYLLCLNINKRLSLKLKFIPVNFGFSKIHPHWGPTLYYWINSFQFWDWWRHLMTSQLCFVTHYINRFY